MGLYIDIHTHHPTHRHIEPMAAGIHPWRAESECLESILFDNFVAIGEIGLDFVCKVDRSVQEDVFRTQLKEAERRQLPVILHCVKAFEPMMKILSEYALPAVIFHGFIGSIQQAQRAIDKGYFLSFSPSSLRSPRTVEVLRNIPTNRFFVETDDSREAIEDMYLRVAHERGISVESLQKEIENNYNNIFGNINE